MLKKKLSISILFVLVMAFPAWGLDLVPGKYEITAKVEMPGMPGRPPQTMVQCLDEQTPVPNASAAAQGCKIKDMKTKGNTVTYTMDCEQQGMEMQIDGEIKYHGKTFDGTTRMNMGPAAGGMIVTTVIEGKRIGACE